MDKQKLVIVLGMHRSGTSAITRGLRVLGVELGNSFIPNYNDNIKGFWEDEDFQAINVEMLHSLGHDWHTLSIFSDSDLINKLAIFRIKALDLLKQKMDGVAGIYGVKDPRFSRLMPFWKDIFNTAGVETAYVIPLRNPISVALSLQKRNGFDFEKSFFLWQQYMVLSATAITPGSPAIVVDFDSMLSQPDVQLRRVSNALNLEKPSEKLLQEYSLEYLDLSLRHAEYSLADLQREPTLPDAVLESFSLFAQLANDSKSLNDKDTHAFFTKQWFSLCSLAPLFRLLDRNTVLVNKSERKVNKLEQVLEERSSDIRQQSKALQQLRETIDRQRTNIETQKRQISEKKNYYERSIDEHKNKIKILENQLSVQKSVNVKSGKDYEKRISQQRLDHEKRISQQRLDYEKRISQQRLDYEKRISQQRLDHEKRISQQRLDYEERFSQQNKRITNFNKQLGFRQREIDGLKRSVTDKDNAIKQKNIKITEFEKKYSETSIKLSKINKKYSDLSNSKILKINYIFNALSENKFCSSVLLGINFNRKKAGDNSAVVQMISNSGLFDESHYLQGFIEEEFPKFPLLHYLSTGWKEGRNPSLLFDGNWYLRTYPDISSAGVCPLKHYLEMGWKENRQPHPGFDSAWYLRFYHDVRSAKMPPLTHYKLHGAKELRRPNKFFDVEWYIDKYGNQPDSVPIASSLEHYLLANKNDAGILFEHNPLFRSSDYAKKNPGFDLKKITALEHFLPRVDPYIREVAQHSIINEGILKIFDDKRAAGFCQRVKRAEFAGNNSVRAPLVSIVMPTHNRQDKIYFAINSVLGQTYDNWELLIVDDGSEDNTYRYVKNTYQDPRIKIQRIDEVCGVCHARNTALSHANGDLIAYLDSDNTWVTDFLELMVAYLGQENADFVYSAIRMQNESGTSYRYREFDYDDLLIKNFIDLNAILHKRELYDQLGGFDESLCRMVDWDLIIRYTKSGEIRSAPFIGVHYDNHRQLDRITVREPKSWRYVIMNKHLIDWKGIESTLGSRDKDLVSIIIPVYGQLDLTRKCVFSLLTVTAGCRFEIILVDNGSDFEVLEELFMWAEGCSEITLVRNIENLNFALGCNLGFANSRGSRVVFLNNDTEVTSGWLQALINPLQQKDIGAVQPKLLFPDGRIQCAGIVFSEKSPLGFPIYADFPSYLPQFSISRRYQAVTAACMATNAEDFVHLGGFDPLFVNGQEDVDFCLRLAEIGKGCWYESRSVVLHHESKTPGRGQFVAQNRALFAQRWSRTLKPDADFYYQQDGYVIRGWRNDGHEVPGYQPVLAVSEQSKVKSIQPKVFAIKISCPSVNVKDEWGDYHFARSLGKALYRAGHSFRIDFLNEWDNGRYAVNEVNLVLRGLSSFEPRKNQLNLMWLISHPDKVDADELEKYDHIFVASICYTKQLQKKFGKKVSCLLQCTDPDLFFPDEKESAFSSDVLFVGNSRNHYREVVKSAIDADLKLSVYGTRWHQFIPDQYIKGENIANCELARYYRNARVILNDHWPDMREKGFVSNRIFDVLACGKPLVSDAVEGLPSDIQRYITFFDDYTSIKEAVKIAGKKDLLRKQERFAFSLKVHEQHSFDARVSTLLTTMEQKLELGFISSS